MGPASEAISARGGEASVDLDALFRAYARDLNGFAFRRLRDREAAADVVQDGFVRCLSWQRRQSRPPTATDTRNVLWRVVSNLTIDFVRRKRVRGEQLQIEAIEHVADPYPTAERIIEGKQAYRLVKMALDESPPLHRAAFLLNRLNGLTHNEIAARLGVSPNTVCNYICATIDRCFHRLGPLID